MLKCYRDFTVIYSQPSIEALKNLMYAFFLSFGIEENIDNIFYYGVFCKPQNYSNFEFDEDEEYPFEIPECILSVCPTENEKYTFVNELISRIMRKEIEKPEWMKYVEMTMICDSFGQPPSTFLYIEPKEEKYAKLAQKLVEFLYSPNMNVTMVKN